VSKVPSNTCEICSCHWDHEQHVRLHTDPQCSVHGNVLATSKSASIQRPAKPTKWLAVGIASPQETAEHNSMMLDYWIAEAQWQESRAERLREALVELLAYEGIKEYVGSDLHDRLVSALADETEGQPK
jgi:hypothetical protein